MLHCSVWTSLLWPWSFHRLNCGNFRANVIVIVIQSWMGKQRFVKKKKHNIFWNVLEVILFKRNNPFSLLIYDYFSRFQKETSLTRKQLFQSLNKIGAKSVLCIWPIKNVFTSIRNGLCVKPCACPLVFQLGRRCGKKRSFWRKVLRLFVLVVNSLQSWKFQAERRR